MKTPRPQFLMTATLAVLLFGSTAARAAPSCGGFLGGLICGLLGDGGGSGGRSGNAGGGSGSSGSGGGSGGTTQGAPEPITLAGLAIGGAGLAWAKRRRDSK